MNKKKDLTLHLVNFLYEQLKQERYADQIERVGVELHGDFLVNNLDIILDIIGYPKDNTVEKLSHSDTIFCRDWLTDKYYDLLDLLKNQEKINEGRTKELIFELISEYYKDLALAPSNKTLNLTPPV